MRYLENSVWESKIKLSLGLVIDRREWGYAVFGGNL